jgi:hypothetical protein
MVMAEVVELLGSRALLLAVEADLELFGQRLAGQRQRVLLLELEHPYEQ